LVVVTVRPPPPMALTGNTAMQSANPTTKPETTPLSPMRVVLGLNT
jgi:hypothetical protein